MQPRSHAFVIDAAIAQAGDPWLVRWRDELQRGHRDEDDLVVLGVRLRAAGLTHSHRPGSPFGELLAPSARVCLLRCVRRARRAPEPEAAWWLGRAAHLLADLAVPARSRKVWHLLGDPLEGWLERHLDALPALLPPSLPLPPGDPGALADSLARRSAGFPVDTTRTPWGQWRFHARGDGTRLDDDEVARQAAALVPEAVAHTAALLRRWRSVG